MHGVVMVWFFLVPAVPVTLGNFVIPLMLGARDLAFPRLNLFSWYLFIVAGAIELFDSAARQTAIAIGTINTAILVCSSFAYSAGVGYLRAANRRHMIECCLVAMGLGTAFLILKFCVEWRDDLANNLFPGADFSIQGPGRGGAKLFFAFYFIGTALHGLHLVAGIILVGWIVWRAHKRQFSPAYLTPVLLVGLYWSFVDIVWLVLYPLI